MEDYGVDSCVCVAANLGLCLYLGLLGVCGGGGVMVVVVPWVLENGEEKIIINK